VIDGKTVTEPDRRLLQLGLVLLLLGLIIGLVIPTLAVPRLGVAAHVDAVIGALFLLVFGLIWPRLRLGTASSRLAFWLAPYSFFVASLMPLLGGIWGAGATMFPLAADAARGSSFQEGVIAGGLITAAIAIITLCGLLLHGLRNGDASA
jgi:hydroxylaminobenzene mutase